MATKKESSLVIKQFKDSSSHFWCNFSHYYLNENNELLWASGESDNIEYRTALEGYIKRNKKTYKARDMVVQIEYNEILPSGKYAQKTVSEVKELDKKYLIWMKDNYKYSPAQEKLKQEIINILK